MLEKINLKKVVVFLAALMVLMFGGLVLLSLQKKNDFLKTPDVHGEFSGKFDFVEKLGEEKIGGYTALCEQKGKFYLYSNGSIYLMNGKGELLEKIDLHLTPQSGNSYITSISVDENGNIYLSDLTAGDVYVVVNDAGKRKARSLKLGVKKPLSILVVAGKIYVFDSADRKLKHFTHSGRLVSQYDLTFNNRRTEFINDIEPVGEGSILLLSDSNNGRILVFDAKKGRVVREISGLTHPRGIDAMDTKRFVVADTFAPSVSLMDVDGNLVERFEVPKEVLEEGFFPFAVAYDKRTKIFVATDRIMGRIYFWRPF